MPQIQKQLSDKDKNQINMIGQFSSIDQKLKEILPEPKTEHLTNMLHTLNLEEL